MWMILHLDAASYSEYEQLRHVTVSLADQTGTRKAGPFKVGALAAEGIVADIVTDRTMPITAEFMAEVCHDHASAIHARYLADRSGIPPLSGECQEVFRPNGHLSELRFRLAAPRASRVFA